jgi:uncharacterized membrane-anchored protein
MQQEHKCPKCNSPISYGVPSCNKCGQPFTWKQTPSQQLDQTPHLQKQPKQRKTNPFLTISLASLVFTVCFILVLVIGNPPTEKNWTAVPLVGLITFLGIFVIGASVLLAKYILSKTRANLQLANLWRAISISVMLCIGVLAIAYVASSSIMTLISSPVPHTTTIPATGDTSAKTTSGYHYASPEEVLSNPAYLNLAWQNNPGGLIRRTEVVNQLYFKTHIYIENETDCNDMAVDIWNMLQAEGIVSIVVAGNLGLAPSTYSLDDCNHTWLLILLHQKDEYKPNGFILEPTNGNIYAGEDFELNPQLLNYKGGFWYVKPSDLKADILEHW